MDYNQLRLKDNATNQPLAFSPELRQKSIERAKKMTEYNKRRIINELFGGSCSACGEIPDLKLIYQLENAKQVTHYCNSCLEKVYETEQVL
jgi:RNase P subunit RPR2